VPTGVDFQDQVYQEELLEWIGLILIDSSRIQSSDTTDPFICRYQLPEAFKSDYEAEDCTIVHLRWNGFMSSPFIRAVVRTVTSDTVKSWCILGSKGLERQTRFTLCTQDHALAWDIN